MKNGEKTVACPLVGSAMHFCVETVVRPLGLSPWVLGWVLGLAAPMPIYQLP